MQERGAGKALPSHLWFVVVRSWRRVSPLALQLACPAPPKVASAFPKVSQLEARAASRVVASGARRVRRATLRFPSSRCTTSHRASVVAVPMCRVLYMS